MADLAIYGGDWPTPDGTGIRDYLHVQDLAEGHVAALRYLAKAHGSVTLNLGSGTGHSVMEVVTAFEKACGRRLTKSIAPRRPGDVAAYYADPTRAESFSSGARRAGSKRSAPMRGGGRRTAEDTSG
jgi:UDP-glucose 4-epimerase